MGQLVHRLSLWYGQRTPQLAGRMQTWPLVSGDLQTMLPEDHMCINVHNLVLNLSVHTEGYMTS